MPKPRINPLTGFDWTAVSWGGADEPAADMCSYCEAPICEDDIPLMLWKKDGSAARFCDACQTRYWGSRAASDFAD